MSFLHEDQSKQPICEVFVSATTLKVSTSCHEWGSHKAPSAWKLSIPYERTSWWPGQYPITEPAWRRCRGHSDWPPHRGGTLSRMSLLSVASLTVVKVVDLSLDPNPEFWRTLRLRAEIKAGCASRQSQILTVYIGKVQKNKLKEQELTKGVILINFPILR